MEVRVPAATKQIDYADLYARWERGNWRATEVDFTQDREDWAQRLSAEQRRGALWLYTLFLHGEDAVTDGLSAYIDAAPLEEQKYFLATQQVDEARHAVFFSRFMNEVVGRGDGTPGGTLAATAEQLTWGHRRIFERLDATARELREDPSPRRLAAAVTLYHIVVEGTLAQPGQHMIQASLEELDMLPGFRAGMANVALDEQRHIAFGVRLLADLCEQDPGCADAIVDTLRAVLPMSSAVAFPPGGDPSYAEVFGFTLEDLYEEAARSQEARLRAIGLPVAELPRFPLPMELPPRERAQRGLTLLRARMIGPKDGPIGDDPAATAVLFDALRRRADPSVVPPGTTIQWEFPDAEPWFLRCADGAATAQPGRAAAPDVTLRSSFEDFVDVSAGRVNPLRLILRRRLRVRGRVPVIRRLPQLFA